MPLNERMKRSRVHEQRKIIVSGIINDHVTRWNPSPDVWARFLPLSSRKRSLFYKTMRTRNFSVTFCAIFSLRQFFADVPTKSGGHEFGNEKLNSKERNIFSGDNKMAPPCRDSWYITEINRGSKENSKRWEKNIASPLARSRMEHPFRRSNANRIMSIRRRWLWTFVLVVIIRRATSDSIIIVEDECSRKFL